MKAKMEKDSLNSRLHLGQLEKAGPKFIFSTEIWIGNTHEMPCAEINGKYHTLSIRVMEKNAIQKAAKKFRRNAI